MHFDLTKLRPMLSYGLFFVPVGLASFVLNFADRYFLRAFSTLEEVGLYALAYKIAMIVTMLVAVPFNQVWHSYLFEIRNQPNAKDVYAKVATYFLDRPDRRGTRPGRALERDHRDHGGALVLCRRTPSCRFCSWRWCSSAPTTCFRSDCG